MRSRAAKIISHVALALSTVVAAKVPAQSPLDGYIEEALAGNGSYLRTAIDLKKAKDASDEARAMLLPRLSAQARATALGGGYSNAMGDAVADMFNSENSALDSIFRRINPAFAALPTDSTYDGPKRDLEVGASLSFPVFNAPAFLGFKARARAVPVAGLDRDIARATLVYQVKSAYYDHLRARETVSTLDALREASLEHLRISEALIAAGRATEDVAFSAQAGLAELDRRRAQAAEAVGLTTARFNSLLGRRLDAAISGEDPADPADPPSASSLPSREECVRAAVAGREELRRLDASRSILETRARLTRAAFLPTIGAQLDAGLRGEDLAFKSEREYLNASIAMKIDLFSGLQRSSALKEAEEDIRGLDLQRSEAEDRIRLEALKAHGDAIVAIASVESTSRSLASSEKSFALVKARYEAGMESDIAYRQAESDLSQARFARLDAYFDYLGGIAYLERVTGKKIAY